MEDINKILNSIEPQLRDELLRMFAAANKSVTVAEIEELVAQGHVDEAIRRVLPQAELFTSSWVSAYVFAATETGVVISREIPVEVIFDQVNIRAVLAMQNNKLRLIQGLTQKQREATREALLNGIRRGLNPREVARDVRASVGLTASQVRAINNYRRALEEGDSVSLRRQLRDRRFDPTVARAIRTGEPLPKAYIDKLVDRYTQRQLKYRAELIARTEALRAVHEGHDEMFRQAIADGHIAAEDLEGTWNTAADARVRDSHITMQGQTQPYGTPFVSGAGNLLRYPGDPLAPVEEVAQCRCVRSFRIKTPLHGNFSLGNTLNTLTP